VLGLKVGHLIYATGNEDAVHHVVHGADVEIICHALDLSQPPEELMADIRELSRNIAVRRKRVTGGVREA
jgi:5-methylcytosine-specific restriction enzyme subunit McrC